MKREGQNFMNRFRRHFVIFMASGCYSGYAPIVPGTFGSAVAIPMFVYLFAKLNAIQYVILFVPLFIEGCQTADEAERIYRQKDSRRIVIDEILGYLVAMFLLEPTLFNVLGGFFWFRFFDVVKLWPARAIDKKMKGGVGVVLDDIAAGVHTLVLMHVALYFRLDQTFEQLVQKFI